MPFKQKEKDVEKGARDLYLSFNLKQVEESRNFSNFVSKLAGAEGEDQRKAAEIDVKREVTKMMSAFARERGIYTPAEIKKAVALMVDDLKKEARELSRAPTMVAEQVPQQREEQAPKAEVAKITPVKKRGYTYSEEVKSFQIAYNHFVDEGYIKGDLLVEDGKRGPKTMAAEEKVRKFLKEKGIAVKGSYAELDKAVREWNEKQGNTPIETAVAKAEEKPSTGLFIPKLAQIYTGGRLREATLDAQLEKIEKERRAGREELNEKRIIEMVKEIRKAISDGDKKTAEMRIRLFKEFVLELRRDDPENFKAAQKLLAELRKPYYAKFGKQPEEKKVAETTKEEKEDARVNLIKAANTHKEKAKTFIERGLDALASEEIKRLKELYGSATNEKEKELLEKLIRETEEAYLKKFGKK
ncbi:MAG: hypothetical protein QXU54_02015 [Candidatus Micrarchaeia archaeon]